MKEAFIGLKNGDLEKTNGKEFPIVRWMSYSTRQLEIVAEANRMLPAKDGRYNPFWVDGEVIMGYLHKNCKLFPLVGGFGFPYPKAKENKVEKEKEFKELKEYLMYKYSWSERVWEKNKQNVMLVYKNEGLKGIGLDKWM